MHKSLKNAAVAITFSIILTACSSTPVSRTDVLPWTLNPGLPEESRLVICVKDFRPKVEVEKRPTTDYLYTGAVTPVENHTTYLAKDFGDVIVKSGGAPAYIVSEDADLDADLLILFRMKHWYGKVKRLDLNPDVNLVISEGEFSGEFLVYRRGVLVAQKDIHCEATPTAIDLHTPYTSQNQNTSQLIIKGLGHTANNALNCGIHKMMDSLESTWNE